MKLNISLYIPVYNGESTIESVLKNALQLDPGADEIIIIDDGSNDQTKEILKKYENRITIIKNKTNQGLGFSRNLAISKSKHQLVASIDADVEPEKKWLLKLYETQKSRMFYALKKSDPGSVIKFKEVLNNIINGKK